MTIDREDMIAHFSAYGEVTGISMNPTRGYAFIDYRTNECVQIALRYVFFSVLHMLVSSTAVLRIAPEFLLSCTLVNMSTLGHAAYRYFALRF